MSLPDLQRKYALSGGANTDVLMQRAPCALDRISCSVTSETYLEVLVPLAKFAEHEDACWM